MELADWLELSALADEDRNASIQDLTAELRRNGTVETYATATWDDSEPTLDESENDERDVEDTVDSRGESTEAISEAVFAELEARDRSADLGYVYDLERDYIQLKPGLDVTASTYIFQLLLSTPRVREDTSLQLYPERQFEALCVRALQSYFGGVSNTRGFKFGWPRDSDYSSFPDALTQVISLLNEGGTVKSNSLAQSRRDDKLDVVVSIPFSDGEPSQLIAFGQCATGTDWESKLSELYDTAKWCEQWMTDPPTVAPLRTFFIPYCIESNRWKHASRRGGVLFERCRIASQLTALDDVEFEPARQWTQRVLQTRKFPADLLVGESAGGTSEHGVA